MERSPETPAAARRLVLTIDLEDWHQLVYRRLGRDGWDVPHAALRRQLESLLALLDEHGARATFFVLGMTAKNHPALVEEIAARGHEVASHGYAHEPVYKQGRDGFRRDVEESCDLLERLCGKRPLGYRAPMFSVNRDTPWAFDVLADAGFRYDSSLYDSPRIPRRIASIPEQPSRLDLGDGRSLWEYPIATMPLASLRIPIGGGGYWRLLPRRLLFPVLDRVRARNPYPVVYFHPYELDPAPLRLERPARATARESLQAAYREQLRNTGRERIRALLREAARAFRLVSYEEIHDEVVQRLGARSHALSERGAIV